MRIPALALLTVVATWPMAADSPSPLLAPAGKGQTAQVKALLDKGAALESTDKNGKTALMLAAQHGHAETVKLLLAHGANPGARDKSGFTAYGLTLLDPEGHGDHEQVLKLLPQPPALRLAIAAAWTPVKLISSCFMDREGMIGHVDHYHLEGMLLNEIAQFAASPASKHVVEIVRADKLGISSHPPAKADGADAVMTIEVEPGAACTAQSGDNLSLSVRIRVFRGSDQAMLLEKNFGGGLKGLRVRMVSNPSQYEAVYEELIKPQASPIYWAVAGALMKSSPTEVAR